MYIEQYSPDLVQYLPGNKNVVADELQNEPMEEVFFTEELCLELYCYGKETLSTADFPLDNQPWC